MLYDGCEYREIIVKDNFMAKGTRYIEDGNGNLIRQDDDSGVVGFLIFFGIIAAIVIFVISSALIFVSNTLNFSHASHWGVRSYFSNILHFHVDTIVTTKKEFKLYSERSDNLMPVKSIPSQKNVMIEGYVGGPISWVAMKFYEGDQPIRLWARVNFEIDQWGVLEYPELWTKIDDIENRYEEEYRKRLVDEAGLISVTDPEEIKKIIENKKFENYFYIINKSEDLIEYVPVSSGRKARAIRDEYSLENVEMRILRN